MFCNASYRPHYYVSRASIQDINGKHQHLNRPTTTRLLPKKNKDEDYENEDEDYDEVYFEKISNNQKQFLSDGKLTILCTIHKPGPPKDESNLADSLEILLHSMDFADIEIKTSNGSIMAHKAILASRSIVFKEGSLLIFNYFLFEFIKTNMCN